MLELGRAKALAQCAARSLATEYPYHLTHLVLDEYDLRLPRKQHPAFGGSFDWHSSVHMHWSLARLWAQYPEDAEISSLAYQVFRGSLTTSHLQTELDYLQHSQRRGFERPYGWAWLLKLDAELLGLRAYAPEAELWRAALQPLTTHIASALAEYLQVLPHPVRHGVHANTAFACILALQWARLTAHWSLADIIEAKARAWFTADMAYGVQWEPSGTDFLSPTLTQALLMSHIVPTAQFRAWFDAYLPIPLTETPLIHVAVPGDRSDGQLVHFDGLNLSRAWCARGLLQVLPLDHAQAPALRQIGYEHMAESARQATEGAFVATHWLTSFLLLAETEYSGVL